MKKRILVVVAILVAALASSCSVDDGVGSVGMTVSALTDTCSGSAGANPLSSIDRLRVEVTGPDRLTGEMTMLAEAESTVKQGSAMLNLPSVPAGLDNVVTVLGFKAGSNEPSWYGRRRDVSVVQGRTTEISMLLTRFDGFTCVTPPDSFTPRAFASSVRLGDGRVLVTGGLASRTDLDATTWELSGASKDAFVFDPSTGEYTKLENGLGTARAGHASVYIPQAGGDKVLIFGGTGKVLVKSGDGFPLSIDSADSLDSYEIFDVKTGKFVEPGNDADGNPKKMRLPRAFLSAVRLFDNTVLVTGGGSWPSDEPEYRFAELWAPYADEGNGGMLDLGTSMPMNSQHNGAAVVKLEDTSQGLSRYLIVGGSTNKESNVEIFTQSSKQQEGASGAFKQRTLDDLPLMFFPTVTRIQNAADGSRRFLVVGGAQLKSGAVSGSPLKAYLLSVKLDDTMSVKKVDSACASRFLHEAVASYDQDKVVLLGGFGSDQAVSSTKTCIFDVATGEFSELPNSSEQFLSRAGFSATVLPDDTLFMAGGMVSAATIGSGASGMVEIFTPSVLWTAETENGGGK